MDKKKYVSKYKKIYKEISENNQKKAQELIERLAEVLEMMDECRTHLEEEGLVVPMDQGKYTIDRENPWSKVYDSKCKLMVAIIDKLDKLLPDQKSESINKAGENLARLVAGGKPIELR